VQELVDATRAVADGNLDIRIESYSADEIGMLIQSFNRMTFDLHSKQQALNASNQELSRINQEIEQRRQYMEIVLRNVAAGVISVDKDGVVTTINKSAEHLLKINPGKLLGRNFRDVLREKHLEIVKEVVRDLMLSRQDTVSRQIFLDIQGARLALHLHLTMLRDEQGEVLGTVLVLARGGPAHRPRDQESAHADPAFGPAAAETLPVALQRR
jgi:two-component system nitrogen regulation sensor histidine kinase NtrY